MMFKLIPSESFFQKCLVLQLWGSMEGDSQPVLFPMYVERMMMEIMEMLGVGVKVGVMIRNTRRPIRFADDQLPMMVNCCKNML